MTNYSETSLYLYGMNHGFWSGWYEFTQKSNEYTTQVFELMYEEDKGRTPEESRQLMLSDLEDRI